MTALDFLQQHRDYLRIEKAIQFLEKNIQAQPDLDQIAESVNLSRYHFSRLFKQWAGISPTQFLQTLTLEYAKKKLAESKSLLDASLDAGLSGPGRLHDLFVTLDAMTPGEFKCMGSGLKITYGFGWSLFGECLLAVTQRGICFLGFVDGEDRSFSFSQLEETWPGSDFVHDPVYIQLILNQVFDFHHTGNSKPFLLFVKGTNFQINVWRALLAIPPGKLLSYQDIAARINRPASVRAAANAIARNPVSFLIPCHRVIAKSGKIHQYRWGTARKKAILGWEAAETDRSIG
ncbi:MAG: 6-O-methylguanine DNA methyltransferase [Desulfobacterium sp.]|nr:6-O-methylguanine DNA methyltransferase [Desulfobacterium sp.]